MVDIKAEYEPKKISHVLLKDIIDSQGLMLREMKKINENLAILGAAVLKMNEGKKKAVDKVK